MKCGMPNRPDCDPQSAIRNPQSGGVLLLVLWLAAALSFVALSLALSVRTELAATQYRLEAEQGRFLARGGLEQALYVLRNPGLSDADGKRIFEPGQAAIDFVYATGSARVSVESESGKLDVKNASVEQLQALLRAAGLPEDQSERIVAGIEERRHSAASGPGVSLAGMMQFSGQPQGGAFSRLEDLLLVPGITPEIFYGWMERDSEGRLLRRGGLNRLMTVYGTPGMKQVNLNFAPYEVLLSVPGMDEDTARRLVAGRSQGRYRTTDDLPVALPLESAPHVTLAEGSSLFTLVATGTPAGSVARATMRVIAGRDSTGQMRLLLWEEIAAP